jgi:PIN domain nuclease of toxin-antitoxin system
MARVVLDSSAVLALLRSESGSEQVEEVIDDALVSAVNEAEVISKLIWRGDSVEKAKQTVAALSYEVIPLDRALAVRAGGLWGSTKRYGLSLGDRCCLALAERERVPALTTDANWRNVAIGVEIKLLRGRPHK